MMNLIVLIIDIFTEYYNELLYHTYKKNKFNQQAQLLNNRRNTNLKTTKIYSI